MPEELARPFQKFDSPMPKEMVTRRLTPHSNPKHRALPASTGTTADSYRFLETDTTGWHFLTRDAQTGH